MLAFACVSSFAYARFVHVRVGWRDIKIGAMSYGRVCFVAFKYKHRLAKIKSMITCLISLKLYFSFKNTKCCALSHLYRINRYYI